MKHNIKLPDGTIQSIDCKLGSGIKDYYDNEIFEGDKIKFNGQVFVTEFTNGHFGLTNSDNDWFDLDLCTSGEIIDYVDV